MPGSRDFGFSRQHQTPYAAGATDDGDPKGPVMFEKPAHDEDVRKVLNAPQTDDGRSDFRWATFANGDVALVVYPKGELFERLMQKGAFQ